MLTNVLAIPIIVALTLLVRTPSARSAVRATVATKATDTSVMVCIAFPVFLSLLLQMLMNVQVEQIIAARMRHVPIQLARIIVLVIRAMRETDFYAMVLFYCLF